MHWCSMSKPARGLHEDPGRCRRTGGDDDFHRLQDGEAGPGPDHRHEPTPGSHVGNALEVVEVVELLQGKCTPEQQDCLELSLLLAAHMIVWRPTDDLEQAREIAESTIRDLSAFAKFKEIVAKQFGTFGIGRSHKTPTADHVEPLTAESDGYLGMLDALAIGKGCVLLGAGRRTLEDVIDPAVGVIVRKNSGIPSQQGIRS